MTDAPDDPGKRPGTVHRQKARREHACSECTTPIPKGALYIYLNTQDPKTFQWKRYVLCQRCERIRSCLHVAELALGTAESYRSGHLREEVGARRRFDRDFEHEFLTAWRASEPVATATTATTVTSEPTKTES